MADPVVESGCAICAVAKKYAVPIVVMAAVVLAFYLYRKQQEAAKDA